MRILDKKQANAVDILVARRVDELEQPIPGSTVVECSECAHPVWLSPSSPTEPKVLCMQCALETMPFEEAELCITTESIDEYKSYTKNKR